MAKDYKKTITTVGAVISASMSTLLGYSIAHYIAPDDVVTLVGFIVGVGGLGVLVAFYIIPDLVQEKKKNAVYMVGGFMAILYGMNTSSIYSILQTSEANRIDSRYENYQKEYKKFNINSNRLIKLKKEANNLSDKIILLRDKVKSNIDTVSIDTVSIRKQITSKVYKMKKRRDYQTWWRKQIAMGTTCAEKDVKSASTLVNCLVQDKISNIENSKIDKKTKAQLETKEQKLREINKNIANTEKDIKTKESKRAKIKAKIDAIKLQANKNVPIPYYLLMFFLLLVGIIIEVLLTAYPLFSQKSIKQYYEETKNAIAEDALNINYALWKALDQFATRTRERDAIHDKQELFVQKVRDIALWRSKGRKGLIKAGANNFVGAVYVAVVNGYKNYDTLIENDILEINNPEKRFYTRDKQQEFIGFGSTSRNKVKGFGTKMTPQQKAIVFLQKAIELDEEKYAPHKLSIEDFLYLLEKFLAS